MGESPVPSAGSLLHDVGKCKPCLFVRTAAGCKVGKDCGYCHLNHRRKDRRRPCKGKRDRYRQMLGKLERDMTADDGQETELRQPGPDQEARRLREALRLHEALTKRG